MKIKVLAVLASVLLALAGPIACTHARSDSQIATDAQHRIQAETALQTENLQVQTNNGVVVLSGSVQSEAARALAENAVRQVSGVKGVVNNLQVIVPAVTPAVAALSAGEPAPRAKPAAGKGAMPVKRPLRSTTAVAPASTPAAIPPVATAKTVPTPVVVPAGTAVSVRLIDPVDTAKQKEGDTFRASLDAPIMLQDKVVVPKNADVTTRLVSAKSAGRFQGTSSVALVITQISFGGKSYDVQTDAFTRQGGSRGKRSAEVIGGGAAAGAVIGAIAGGGKGAAIGAAAGAGAGTGFQALTKGEQIKLPAETLLQFQLAAPLTVMPAGGSAEPETSG